MTQREFIKAAASLLASRLRERGGKIIRAKGTRLPRPERPNKISALDLARQRRLFD